MKVTQMRVRGKGNWEWREKKHGQGGRILEGRRYLEDGGYRTISTITELTCTGQSRNRTILIPTWAFSTTLDQATQSEDNGSLILLNNLSKIKI